jgi:hypothetical protein
MQDGTIHVLIGHAAKPQRPPFQISKVIDRVPADRDERAFDRAELIQVFGGEELGADEHIERQERGAQQG